MRKENAITYQFSAFICQFCYCNNLKMQFTIEHFMKLYYKNKVNIRMKFDLFAKCNSFSKISNKILLHKELFLIILL